jgi:uncharacterized membrane protein (DUF485 family)
MASSASSGPSSGAAGARRGDGSQPPIDWIAAEQSPEFRELIARRRAFVLPATIFFFVWYFGFILLAGYAPGFMGTPVYEGFTVGYLIALTQFVMVWGFGAAYLIRSNSTFDPLAAKAAETAVEAGRKAAGGRAGGGGRSKPGGSGGRRGRGR